MEIFSVPVGDKYLLYAPLQQFLALVNQKAENEIRRNLLAASPVNSPVSPFIQALKSSETSIASIRNPFDDSAFLGIIPTRGCNARCRYCDFAAPRPSRETISISLARESINAYLLLRQSRGHKNAEVHFFGGEPFVAEDIVQFSVEYATVRAAELDMSVRFEVTTNGIYRPALAHWIGQRFDAVVLSLDGPRDIQDLHRPLPNGKSGFDLVYATAKMLSESDAELILRACVTAQTAQRMEEIALWMAEEFTPSEVCFETLTPSDLSVQANLLPPDPWEFAAHFVAAARMLEARGIPTRYSTAETEIRQSNFCPIGKGALIVAPDGMVSSCYLLEENWTERGLDLRLGQIENGEFNLSPAALESMQNLRVENRPLCADCFCRWHCAGGCTVNHDTSAPPGQFDAPCIQTRLISLTRLLERLGQDALAKELLSNPHSMEAAVWRQTDRIGE
jgi:radical SAM protein with 4Fe4S-binding SPASM domain